MKRNIISLVLVLLATALMSKRVEQGRAIAIATGFIAEVGNADYVLDSVQDFGSNDLESIDFYIVSFNPEGFVLVSADTRSIPILGYSFTSPFPKAQIPAHTKWYLDQYSLSLMEIRKHPQWQEDPGWTILEQNDYSPWHNTRGVAPLLSTTWNQDWPYNSLCPADAEGPGGHVLAGCVATAMAQVMKRWNHPIVGNGTHSYESIDYGMQNANFGATSYNWANMPNNVEYENNDVATLLYHCGIAVNMDYSPYASGAGGPATRDALVNYFRYHDAAQWMMASDYPADTWVSMLRADLDLERPICYLGQNFWEGHAFVLDGYQGTDYFHFNWGWSGDYDGFFHLNNLNPNAHSFTQNQCAIMNLHPLNSLVNDLTLVSLTGPVAITVDQTSTYTATVANIGTVPQSSYWVRLMLDSGIQLAEMPGTYLTPGTTQTFTLDWTPTQTGVTTLYATVVFDGDEVEPNNESQPLSVVVMPEDIQFVTIGTGDGTSAIPMNFNHYSSLYQCIYMGDELNYMMGTITSLMLYNQFSSNIFNSPAKIWLGSTELSDLRSGFIPAGELTLVWDGSINYPLGENEIIIPLSVPYLHTQGNLVMMVQRPMDTTNYYGANYFRCQPGGTNRARTISGYQDFNPMNPPSGMGEGQIPKITFYYSSDPLQNDLGCFDLVGSSLPSVGQISTYTVMIKNYGQNPQSNYQIKLMQHGGGELCAINGPSIEPMQILPISLNWTPAMVGSIRVYAQVVLAGDEVGQNDESNPLSIAIQEDGVQVVTIGEGNLLLPYPMDFHYKSSLYQCLIYENELNFIGGTITALQLYNSFSTQYPNGAAKIWLGCTNQADLSAGYIPADMLTLVFDGDLQLPAGQNPILIYLNYPYLHESGNLVMMVQRPMDVLKYSASDCFQCQTASYGRARSARSNTISFDPMDPPAGTLSTVLPKISVLYLGGKPVELPPSENIPAISNYLGYNYPNPFNPETTITYSLREASPVTIEIYNIKGQLVKTLVNDTKAAGTYTVVWNGMDNSNRSVSSGVYYYKMHAGKYSSTRKMILMK